MLLLFFMVWIIFNGRITTEIVLVGVAVSALMFAFLCQFMAYSVRKEIRFYQKIPLLTRYLLVLIKEIVKANLTTCHMILTRQEEMEPVIVCVHTDLKTETARVILANSITLTPGTITVSLKGNDMLVHCLDKSLANGLDQSEFARLLKCMEEGEKCYGGIDQRN